MEKRSDRPSGEKPSTAKLPLRRPMNTWMVFFLLVGTIVVVMWYYRDSEKISKITLDFFYKQLNKLDEVTIGGKTYHNVAELEQAIKKLEKAIKELEWAEQSGEITKEQKIKLGEQKRELEEQKREKKNFTNIESVDFRDWELHGEFIKPPDNLDPRTKEKEPKLAKKFFVVLTPSQRENESLEKNLIEQGVKFQAQPPQDSTGWMFMIYIAISMLLFFGVLYFIRRAQSQMMGGGSGFLGSFSKSPARRYEAGQTHVTFDDVAGLQHVKADLEEVVSFLKNPEKFQRLGGRIPKGTLLVGPPGTGKTLLARAVAGEADVPFYSINGSEFIQMFVGVGASRVRDLFQTARENSPCILFVDEIDAVGRVRGAGLGGGHDEREQTLNQILSEMDGFTPDEAVIVLAATNRPDVLDPALLRPGRFDRHITVDKPSLKARADLFEVHCREVKISKDLDFRALARGTVGLTGADIRNLVNEATLLATRLGKKKVEMIDFDQARDKVLMGAKRDEVLSADEKRMTAYHECGHALVAWLIPSRVHVHKITIIPRGRALGVTHIQGEEDRLSASRRELQAMLMCFLGGRAAEKLVFDEYYDGTESDLEKATDLARRMVTVWGMSDRLGPVSYKTAEDQPFLGREIHEQRHFSEHTNQIIDEEVAKLLHLAFEEASRLLEKNRDKLDILAVALEQREELDEAEITELIGLSTNAQNKEKGGPSGPFGWGGSFSADSDAMKKEDGQGE